ncbi:solute carrier family 32 (vesicular inhibitory amino acid transporter) [Marchantia polymorpha subsp. ruderalis]|uniref:Amino acid transporter transmembrane domain-containing protein n=2 Tax=Marchantia polymorpha TaxID=3197 RepID=A0AAF6B1W2_MARPO|nr:hypothetical protein MARPO_0039s0036 [Marchantia polymorpha]BBN05996.1 hypothetical protein Mp_3g17580 [Marchantia polymorpha subsp. ruderalis]|eukprot:PTQ40528.1 hypothetical protein MARPO_0039s0036 [Marchantia polymorpha]
MSEEDNVPELGNGNTNSSSTQCGGRAESADIPPRDGDEVPHLNLIPEHRLAQADAIPIKASFGRSPSALSRVSSSLSRRGALWPQSFERQMEIYSRSLSGKYREEVCDANLNGDSISADQLDADSKESVLLHSKWDDPLKEPLLRSASARTSGKLGYSRSRSIKEDEQSLVANEAADVREEDDKVLVGGESSFVQACLNGTNVLAGVGILSTPYALSQGGWSTLGFLLLFAVICLYTGILLRKCLDADPSIVSYPDIGQAAFGRKGRLLVSIMLYFELYCVTVEYLIMEGDNLANIFPFTDVNIGNSRISAHQLYIIFSGLIFMPTVWLRDLGVLSYISAGGVIAVLAILSTVGYVGAFEGVGFSHTGTLVNFSGLPVAVGICAFCFCGHAVFPSIYRSMKNQEQFSKVLIVCFTAVTIMYGGVGVMGYTMFGDEVESQVTLNLPKTLISSRIAIWIILVNPFAKFALTITPLAVALEEFLPWSPKSKQFMVGSVCIRSLLVLSTIVVALAIPFFGLMMGFIGSFLSISVAVILPCLCYLQIYGRAGGISSAEYPVLIVVVFIGIITGSVGTYSAIRGMIGNIKLAK